MDEKLCPGIQPPPLPLEIFTPPLFQGKPVSAYNKQRDFKPKYSTYKLYCIQGIYKIIAIIKILNISLCIYNEICS